MKHEISTYFYIYKITNKVTGEYYVGKYKTTFLHDGFMGEGEYMQKAVDKYGIENFTKQLVYSAKTEGGRWSEEKENVVFNIDFMLYILMLVEKWNLKRIGPIWIGNMQDE